jgi:hypothetical protein
MNVEEIGCEDENLIHLAKDWVAVFGSHEHDSRSVIGREPVD